MFDDNWLASFIHKFFGCGELRTDFWFIGMEEGGGKSTDEIRNRLRFCGTSNLRWWRQISDQNFQREPSESLSTAWIGKTLLVVMKHPAPPRRGIPNEYLDHVGRIVA